MKKYIIAVLFISAGLFFVFDPYNWWPIDHLVGKGKTPCIPEDVRPTCTGKINFFWQRP